MIYRMVARLHAERLPVTIVYRLLAVSNSGYYEWRSAAAGLRPRTSRSGADCGDQGDSSDVA